MELLLVKIVYVIFIIFSIAWAYYAIHDRDVSNREILFLFTAITAMTIYCLLYVSGYHVSYLPWQW